MLKNDYLDLYLQKSRILSEFEKEIQQDDDNYVLNLSRPLSTDKIKDINNKNLFKFIDDLFCNQSINNLLFSSTANKELDLFLKTKRLTQNKNNKNLKNVVPTSYSLYFKREKKNTINKIKQKINEFKTNRKTHLTILKKKNIKFINNLKKESNNENTMKEFYIPINEIRKKNFKRVLNKCMSLQEFNVKSFKLPNVKLENDNVFSRLYKNHIYVQSNEKKRDKNKIKIINDNNYNNLSRSRKNSLYKKNLSYSNYNVINNNDNTNNNIIDNKSNLNNNYKNNNNNKENNKKILHKYNIKNSLSNNLGKEFTVKITSNLIKKSFLKYSGGPFYFKKIKNSNENKIEDDDEIDNKKYYIKLKDLKDKDGNNNLHLSVIKNLEKFVEYFLEKGINPNSKNNYGETSLHLAMKNNNEKIIEMLLNKGADISIYDNDGYTPFELANKKIIKLFDLERQMNEIRKKEKKNIKY